MIFADPASQSLAKLLGRIAASDVPVMITGDTGTGKGTIARRIHQLSGRSGSLLCINCSVFAEQSARYALSDTDARPAALDPRAGCWFETARHGTLFLDEIVDLPLTAQSQLLRLLQEQEAERAGLRAPQPADVRLVATTSVDLGEAVAAGHFRLELLYRLNVGQVRLLPLRERRGDVSALAEHFLRLHSARLGRPPPALHPAALAALGRHPWPGNVRELENVIRFALLVSSEREMQVEHLRLPSTPAAVGAPACPPITPLPPDSRVNSLARLLAEIFQAPGNRLLNELEREIVGEAFRFTGGNQVRTAALLGVSRNVLRTLLRKHALLVVRRRRLRARVEVIG